MALPARPPAAACDPRFGEERRPLYLDARVPTRVGLDDPALSIRVKGQALRLLPLRRVARIVANARTEFTTAALLACASRGIAIVFVEGDRGVVARVLGSPGNLSSIPARLVDFLDTADWEERYATWLHAEERRAVARVQRRLDIPGSTLPTRALARKLDIAAQALAGDPVVAEATAGWLGQAVFGAVFARLQALGFGAPSEVGQDGRLDLAADLARVLSWYGEPWRLAWLHRRKSAIGRAERVPAPVQRLDMIRLFEHHHDRFDGFLRETTNRLHRWLVELA